MWETDYELGAPDSLRDEIWGRSPCFLQKHGVRATGGPRADWGKGQGERKTKGRKSSGQGQHCTHKFKHTPESSPTSGPCSRQRPQWLVCFLGQHFHSHHTSWMVSRDHSRSIYVTMLTITGHRPHAGRGGGVSPLCPGRPPGEGSIEKDRP